MSYADQTLQLENLTPSSPVHRIPLHAWFPEKPARAAIHISHGMAEYGGRYQQLARQFNAEGFKVYAHDHRGHGESPIKGHFTDKDGWKTVVSDQKTVVDYVLSENPGTPCFLLGHSMGSYILQAYLTENRPAIKGAILSGSNYVARPLLALARLVASIEIRRQGKTGNSPLIHELTFGGYNRRFKPNRTEFDWLSRAPEAVDAYANDPLCGFRCTNQLWADIFEGLTSICSPTALSHIDNNLPIQVMGGDQDPVSAPRGLHKLTEAIKASGNRDVSLTLYPGARHELFNETNRKQVFEQLIQWLENHIHS